MPKKTIDTNTALLDDLMTFSPCGPLAEIFIMHAIRHYAEQVAASTPAELDTPVLSGAAWHRCGVDIAQRMAAFYDRHNAPAAQAATAEG